MAADKLSDLIGQYSREVKPPEPTDSEKLTAVISLVYDTIEKTRVEMEAAKLEPSVEKAYAPTSPDFAAFTAQIIGIITRNPSLMRRPTQKIASLEFGNPFSKQAQRLEISIGWCERGISPPTERALIIECGPRYSIGAQVKSIAFSAVDESAIRLAIAAAMEHLKPKK